MAPDEFQQAWQSPASQTRVTIHTDALRSEVLRNQQNFNHMIWARDVREIGVALLLIPVWFVMGHFMKLPWSWYLMVPSLLGVAGFMLLDRRRHPQNPSPPGASLVQSVEVSLRQVEHQIWLLRNVVWWYLLPFTVPMMIFFVNVSWDFSVRTGQIWAAVIFLLFLVTFVLAIYGFIYWINQRAVRMVLEPRRRELLALLASLNGS